MSYSAAAFHLGAAALLVGSLCACKPQSSESPPHATALTASPATTPADPHSSTNALRTNREPDVVFIPTPQAAVDAMLEMAEVKPGDVVYDLGCGDGRIVVTAAKKYGVRAVGFDINPDRVRDSLANVKTNGVEHLVTIREADIFTLDLREATVVTLYLLPDLNVRLMPQLAQLRPGSRIVSHDFAMRGAQPKEVRQVTATDDSGEKTECSLYKWVVPWEPETKPWR